MKLIEEIEKRLPRRLTSRIILGVAGIVVAAGMVTTLAINQILANSLRAQLIRNGHLLAQSLGESISNDLIEGNFASIQSALNNLKESDPDIVYIFAYGPHTPVIHTFSDGFPMDLLRIDQISWKRSGGVLLLQTENGLIWDFAVYPLDSVIAAVHIGVSERRILAEQWKITRVVILMTIIGCILAAALTLGVMHLTMNPLVELTHRVRNLGKGNYDQRINIPLDDEIGELGQAFNVMADGIQQAIERLKKSERGYRALLKAAGDVGEGIALICESGPREGEILYVNDTFGQILGYYPSHLIGVNISAVLHPYGLEEVLNYWNSIRNAVQHNQTKELMLLDRQGNRHILDTAATVIEYEDRRALAWFVRDITERKQREEELRLRNRELTALNAVSFALNQPYTKEFLGNVLRETLYALELSIGWIMVIGENGRSQVLAAEGIDASLSKFPRCSCGDVLETGRIKLVQSSSECVLAISNKGKVCHVTVPFGSRQNLRGVLSVAFPSSYPFEDHHARLLLTIAHQIGIGLENVRLWEELREKERIRAELLHKALQAQEEERYRIARELHDETGQSLNALVFGLKALEASLSSDIEQARKLISRLKSAVADTIRELQRVIYDLRPTLLDDLGLIPALHWYAESRLEEMGIEVIWQVNLLQPRLPPQVETALFRIAQEAITNISKYACASQVRILLEEQTEANQVLLQIWDNGIGFELDRVFIQPTNLNQGLGLMGMRERAELLGGKLEWSSSPGQGTLIRAKLPLPQVEGEKFG